MTTTIHDFDPDVALDRLLAGMEEIVDGLENIRIAILTIETSDHRKARLLLQEMVQFYSNDHAPFDLRDWMKEARKLVPPDDDPLPTAEQVRGILSPEAPLPVIQQDEE